MRIGSSDTFFKDIYLGLPSFGLDSIGWQNGAAPSPLGSFWHYVMLGIKITPWVHGTSESNQIADLCRFVTIAVRCWRYSAVSSLNVFSPPLNIALTN